MKPILFIIALGVLLECTPARPRMPAFATSVGQECGERCLRGHTWCMEAACPAKATSSCGPRCDQMLTDCYRACLQGEGAFENPPSDAPSGSPGFSK